jgi:hypothetical protein
VFSAWWCGSVGTTWTLELRRLDHATPIHPAEWICSGVPIDQPSPTTLTVRLLAQRDLLLYPDSPRSRPPQTLNRQLIGYVTRDPDVITLAKALPKHATRHEHPMVCPARWIHAGYTCYAAADKILAGLSPPRGHDASSAQ